jgi:hypothetical protein
MRFRPAGSVTTWSFAVYRARAARLSAKSVLSRQDRVRGVAMNAVTSPPTVEVPLV